MPRTTGFAEWGEMSSFVAFASFHGVDPHRGQVHTAGVPSRNVGWEKRRTSAPVNPRGWAPTSATPEATERGFWGKAWCSSPSEV